VIDEPDVKAERRRLSDAAKKMILAQRFIRRASHSDFQVNEERNIERLNSLGLHEDEIKEAAFRELGDSDDEFGTEPTSMSMSRRLSKDSSAAKMVRRLSESNIAKGSKEKPDLVGTEQLERPGLVGA
jgi:hypothetical protein